MVKDGHKEGTGFWPGFVTGLSLGLVWAPCAGPILASVTALAATQELNFASVIVVVSYAIGSGIPLLAIAYGGRSLIQKVPFLSKNLGKVQKLFGVVMILTAVLIALNVDVLVTVWATNLLPEGWTSSLTALETGDTISEKLNELSGGGGTPSYFTNDADAGSAEELPVLGPSPEITGITNWVNSEPLSIAGLQGKVVLVDFWTYSCVNCVRTLPYITAWHEKYADDGLVILGIHTPEFEFEKDTNNVLDALDRFGIEYPVAQDNDFATWRAFENRYWPAKYIIDAEGNIRYTHFGEGAYEETELVIQQLLAEAGKKTSEKLTGDPDKPYSSAQTPELYVGFGRQKNFMSPDQLVRNEPVVYEMADSLPLHTFSVDGNWTFNLENATVNEGGAQLRLHFAGKDIYLVMDSPEPAQVKIEVLFPDVENNSPDLDDDGVLIVDEARLYHLASFDEFVEGEILITYLDPGVQTFAFTFGS